MAENVEAIKSRKKARWPSDSFKPKTGSISDLHKSEVPKKLAALNLSSNFYSIHTSALPEKEKYKLSRKPLGIKRRLLNQVEKYCENTTLHGLRYVGDPQLTFGERIFWFISFILAVGFAAYYISDIYNKWKSSPVIISFSPFDADLSSIPFPAVTICNMNQAKKTEAEKILKEGSIIEKQLLDDSCDGNATFNSTENIDWEYLRTFLIRVGNTCSDMLQSCQWGSEIVNCEDIFTNELTDEGLCCSFNRMPPSSIFRNWQDVSILNQSRPTNVFDWDAENGFGGADTGDSIPRRPLGAGAHLGLSVLLDAHVDNYYCSSTRSTGFKIILSNPLETPKMADFGILIGTGFEARIAIEPSVREATDTLRIIPIEKRQCYFTNERSLIYYRTYSQTNCLLECQSQYTIKLCGCVPYYLPKNKETRYCGRNEKNCVDDAKQIMDTVSGNDTTCHCLPACFSVKYPYGKSLCHLSKKGFNDVQNTSSEYLTNNVAVIQFFFYNSQFMTELKSELFGFTEILSNTGGLLSLFLGFSFLSVVELVYFIFVRIVCNVTKRSDTDGEKKKEIIVQQFLR